MIKQNEIKVHVSLFHTYRATFLIDFFFGEQRLFHPKFIFLKKFSISIVKFLNFIWCGLKMLPG